MAKTEHLKARTWDVETVLVHIRQGERYGCPDSLQKMIYLLGLYVGQLLIKQKLSLKQAGAFGTFCTSFTDVHELYEAIYGERRP